MEKKSYTFEEIKQKMVNYCVYQDRSHKEVEEKMREFLLIEEAKDEILEYLLRENFLSEERFARSYARGKFYMKSWGKGKIRMGLKQKGVGEKLISIAMQEIYPDDYRKTLTKLATSYMGNLSGLQGYQKRIKTTRYLLSRGFEYDLITDVLSEIEGDS